MLSVGHAAVMALGGVLALLIAHRFGRTPKTDAFFAAYGVYAIALVFGQTFRLTAIPRLVNSGERDVTDRLIAAVIAMSLVALVPMVALAGPIGSVLVAHDPNGVAGDSLRALWPALAGQLMIGLLAGVLVVRGAFNVIGLGYVMSGVSSIVLFLALRGPLGIQAVSAALGASTACLAALFLAALVRRGWRPSLGPYLDVRRALRESGHLLLASMSFVAANLGYVICLAVASREGTGEATLYAYAYFSAALLVATTAVSGAMVRAPQMLSADAPVSASGASSISTYRFTLLLVLPVLGLAALVGKPVLAFVLGDAFGGPGARHLVTTLLCLSGWVLGSAAAILAIVELIGRRQIRRLALIACAQLLVLPPLAILGRELAGIEGVGAAQSLAMIGATGAQLRLAFGPDARRVGARMVEATATGVLAVAAAFAPGFVLVATLGDSAGVMVLAAALGLALSIAISRLVWRQEFAVVLSMVRPKPAQAPAVNEAGMGAPSEPLPR